MKTGDNQQSQDALYEALTLNRTLCVATMPPYYGYKNYGYDRWWTSGVDIVYLNQEGKKHRIYGPAYISKKYDIEEWHKNGVFHREGGPAVRHRKNMYWFKEGVLHRLDGPAIDTGGGPKEYWVDGQQLSPKEYKKEIARRNRKNIIK